MSTSNLHVIVGLGITGLSCARYLKEQGIPIAVTDTRPNPPHLAALQAICPDVKTAFGGLDESLLNQAAVIVLSPGIALREPIIAKQIQRGVPVVGDIELFAQAIKVPVIAITGTNAKSTVTTLVGEMAKAAGLDVQVGGNLGIPALDLLAERESTQLFVLELSSFQLETTYSLQPAVATVLNITPDHMDRYETLTDYQQAKLRVYSHAKAVVCNRDDSLTECNNPINNKYYFTCQAPQQRQFGLREVGGVTYLVFGDHQLVPVSDLPVMGKHYHANALASLAIGHAFGLPFEPMLKVLREFKGLPHRCQLVRERHAVRWYNDSKGTNIGATQAAIEGLGSEIQGKIILIAGGIGKHADFTTLVPTIEKYSRHVVLIGEAAQEIARAIGDRVAISFADNMQTAVAKADQAAKQKDCVLLSPACASFDMFKNFEHRGQVFTEIVQGLM